MFKKVVGSLAILTVFCLAASAQLDVVRAGDEIPPLTAPVSAPISVSGKVLYKYQGQARPAVGALVTVTNPYGSVVAVAIADSEGKYSVNASGYEYFVFNASDAYGTIFSPANKRINAGLQLLNADFAGRRPL